MRKTGRLREKMGPSAVSINRIGALAMPIISL
jgi:hypothetical protein